LLVAVCGAVFLIAMAVGERAGAALNICPGPGCGDPCASDADCGCTLQQLEGDCMPETGAGGSCVEDAAGLGEDRCVCNPGYSPPNCAQGACCRADGSCTETGQGICEDGGLYEGDGVSCTAVNCPLGCGYTSAPECGGFCTGGTVCVPISAATGGMRPTGDCECAVPTTTATPTATASATPTNTAAMMGGPCEETVDCAGGLVCDAGICTGTAAEAPAVSGRGVLVIVGLLFAVGGFTILRRRTHV